MHLRRTGQLIFSSPSLLLLLLVLCGCPRKTTSGAPTSPPGPVGQLNSLQYTTGLFAGCPPEGSGGDGSLNRLKNRDLPPPAYETLGFAQIVANHPPSVESQGRADRERWSLVARTEVAAWENRAVSVEGYLIKARQQEPESCNCKDTTRRDYHLWMVEHDVDDRDRSIVVEVSPRLLPNHPNWRLRILSRLSKDRARVRVSGWLMWDQEHPDQVGKTRGTQWEIHPIHRIEVWSGGRWRDLDG